MSIVLNPVDSTQPPKPPSLLMPCPGNIIIDVVRRLYKILLLPARLREIKIKQGEIN